MKFEVCRLSIPDDLALTRDIMTIESKRGFSVVLDAVEFIFVDYNEVSPVTKAQHDVSQCFNNDENDGELLTPWSSCHLHRGGDRCGGRR